MADDAGTATVRTACPYCGVGCGILAAPTGERSVGITGDASHPANLGRLCSKGSALGATVNLEGRLLFPQVDGQRVAWPHAIQAVADRFADVIARKGPDAVAFYVSGQILTEDYYAANKLMKGFIGSANIDTNSRLCMASAVGAHKQAFGADLVPGCYEDLDLADLVVFSGHNAAWTHPVLYRRMEAARARGQIHVCVDPRRTDTAEGCDLHLPLAPQTDIRLWNGLLADMIRRGRIDRAYIDTHVSGFAAVETSLRQADQSLSAVAADCGLAAADVQAFYDLFATHDKTVSLFSMGANQSAQGVAKGLAILNVHLATGRIGKPGSCPFSITGQPNAMGGRETGGMANTLAGHMDFNEADLERVSRFWGTDCLSRAPGLKAVDMFEAVHSGQIEAIWIMATNPAVSMPDSNRVREALARCPTVVVSECIEPTDTSIFAHIKLPALAWGEKDGTVTNSERRISRQRPLFPPPGEARADWAIIADVARAMGHAKGFDWASPAAVFDEWAHLSAFENGGSRWLDLGGLRGLTGQAYDDLRPVQWPVGPDGAGTPRLFTDGGYQTPDRKARMVPVEAKGPHAAASGAFPFSLNTGRIRDQWHTMTRTGLAASLCQHEAEPMLDIHPDDARDLSLTARSLARVTTAWGDGVFLVRPSDRQRRGDVFVPLHWTDQYAPQGRSNSLIGPARDPVSGQPEFKHTPARIEPFPTAWRGFVLSRKSIRLDSLPGLVWRRLPRSDCVLYELAADATGPDFADVRTLIGNLLVTPDIIEMRDSQDADYRAAWLENDRLAGAMFLTRSAPLPPRDWLAGLFAKDRLDDLERALVLGGCLPGQAMDTSPLVCACMAVRQSAIDQAIADGADTVETISTQTCAGTQCGSCRPEIARLLTTARRPEPQNG